MWLLLWVLAANGAVCNVSLDTFNEDCEWPGSWTVDRHVSFFMQANVKIMGNVTIAGSGAVSIFAAPNVGIGAFSVFGALSLESGSFFEWVTQREHIDFLTQWAAEHAAIGTPRRPHGLFSQASVRFTDGADPCIAYSVLQFGMVDGVRATVRASESTCEPSGGLFLLIGAVLGAGLVSVGIYLLVRWCIHCRQQKMRAHVQLVDETAFNDDT